MFEFANPKRFMDVTAPMLPWIGGIAAVCIGVGCYFALFVVPPERLQGDTVRIMYVHVPAAWASMMTYGIMALVSLLALVNRHPLADIAAREAAPLGALFTALALITGSLWGKPTWGTYWVWDARLTSFLLLLFLYLGYIALWNAIEDEVRAARAAAVLAIVGAVNLPIIVFSVEWWNTLHQGESIFRRGGPSIAPIFLWPLLIMAVGYTLLFLTLWILRIRTAILARAIRTRLSAESAP
ncbi:MAG TPA: heme ABC transporter permease CcmC [Rhizomicrobium sp.]|nr:heme ABC transporter permease CcmC [Rhizomicrobium sp.]